MSVSSWPGLKALAAQQGSLRQAFAEDPTRAEQFSTQACGITLDYSKNLINRQSWQALQQLAAQSRIKPVLSAMLAGEKINNTEQRSVWHMMLRKSDVQGLTLDGVNIGNEIQTCRNKMTALVKQLHQQQHVMHWIVTMTD